MDASGHGTGGTGGLFGRRSPAEPATSRPSTAVCFSQGLGFLDHAGRLAEFLENPCGRYICGQQGACGGRQRLVHEAAELLRQLPLNPQAAAVV